VPAEELERARAYASGRLELRLEESRHMAAWLGVQEALHDRVLTPDEAIAEMEAVTPEGIQQLAGRLVQEDALCLAVIGPRGIARKAERALRLPR
jgi:predicted Zn-dependent peptidase